MAVSGADLLQLQVTCHELQHAYACRQHTRQAASVTNTWLQWLLPLGCQCSQQLLCTWSRLAPREMATDTVQANIKKDPDGYKDEFILQVSGIGSRRAALR